jgi:hypothetical protein
MRCETHHAYTVLAGKSVFLFLGVHLLGSAECPPTPFARPQCTHGAPYLVLGLASRTRSLHGTCSRIPCQPRHSSKGRRRRRAQSYLRKLPVTESIASGER